MLRREVVVGVDDSESARRAMRWAAEYARVANLRLRALHVVDEEAPETEALTPGIRWANAEQEPSDPTPPADRIIIEGRIRRVFDSVNPRTDWDLEFAAGGAGEVLVSQAQGATLLVVGTREHTGLGRLREGSISHYCLSHATCPVVAVPLEGRAAATESRPNAARSVK